MLKEVRGSYGVGLWKAIRLLWELVFSRTLFVVGNGRRVKFWKDGWCGDEPLCVSLPSLFALASSKEAWVADLWVHSSEGGGWNPSFSRPLNDWEIEIVECFLSRIQDKVVVEEREDEVFWAVTKNGSFSVKSLISILEEVRVSTFPTSIVWDAWVPPKVGFFCLGGNLGKVLTLDQLQRRGWSLASRWSLCYAREESIDHILLHCGKARLLWELLFSLFRMCWVIQASVRETLLGWQGSFIGRKRKKVWSAAPLSLFWTIWKERNRRSFENMKLSVQRLKVLVFVQFTILDKHVYRTYFYVFS